MVQSVKGLTERLETDKRFYGKKCDAQAIEGLMKSADNLAKAAKDLWEALDKLHGRRFPARGDTSLL